ncbi:hypothetical protein [Lactiplantibacillus paraxiangfangensis]|uniref:hypothetical protein n=1 Tax=Lactiplantibacillus paraxiangfangensis TaxID=3076224 RepID=UPI0030C6981B
MRAALSHPSVKTKHDQTATAATLPQTNETNMSWVAGLGDLLLARLAAIAWRMRRN